MSREIIFRGKCIDETCLKGQWLEGQILHDEVTGKYYINTGNCLNESDIVGEEGLLRFVAYEVDPETVCQYTGLTDKNGRKIFEGDIITYEKRKFHVVWVGNIASFVSKPLEDVRICPCMNIGTMKASEVIGNVFDNPELLD